MTEKRTCPLLLRVLLQLVLRIYPTRFRRRYGEDISWSFCRQYQERIQKGRTRALSGSLFTLADLARAGLQERWQPALTVIPIGRFHFPEKENQMDALLQELKFAWRMTHRHPLFAVVAILTLALGIGANVAVFGFFDSLLMQELPYPEAGRLVRLYATAPERSYDTFSHPNFVDLRERVKSLESLAAHSSSSAHLQHEGATVELSGEVVSGNYFQVFQVPPLLGRTLLPSDDQMEGQHPVVVLSHRAWVRDFESRRDVVGARVELNGHPFRVVGVMPEFFAGSYNTVPTDFWGPLAMHQELRPSGLKLDRRGWGWLRATGRLQLGVELEAAASEMSAIAAQLREEFSGNERSELGFRLVPAAPFPEAWHDAASGIITFGAVLVGLVLLVVCANIASVLLARAVARQREFAIRRSLGAYRRQLFRQWILEGLVLAVAGAAAGLMVAYWTHRGLVSLVSDPALFSGFEPSFQGTWQLALFVVALAIASGAVFGLIPAWKTARVKGTAALREEPGFSTRPSRLFGTFVVAQVAISVILLIGAGLLIRTLDKAESFNPGFDTSEMLVTWINVAVQDIPEEEGKVFFNSLLASLNARPEVASATLTTVVPLGGNEEVFGFTIPGHEPSVEAPAIPIDTALVGPNYLETMKIPLLRGVGFRAPSDSDAVGQAIVNETMANRFWPGGDALGQRFQFGTDGRQLEVVGVAADIDYYDLGEEPRSYLYLPLEQAYSPRVAVQIRASGRAADLTPLVRQEIAALDARLVPRHFTTFEEMRKIPLFPQRVLARVSAIFSLLALVLTALGLYGILTYSVGRRTREIGIRVALGGAPSTIRRMVMLRGLSFVAVGLLAGLGAAAFLTRFLESLLFGVSSHDPLTFALISLLMLGVAAVACYLPARRATRIDPLAALRYE